MGRRWTIRIINNMKKLTLSISLIFTLITCCGYAQQYKTRKGNIEFEASVSGFEEVKAKTNTVSVIFDASSGSLASLVLVNGFQFKVGLMQEHFNENYMESTSFPKATFIGIIQDFNAVDLSNNAKNYVLVGDLTIHGVTKTVKINCQLIMDNSEIAFIGVFNVAPEDYGIDIPKLVMNKIAKDIQITFNYKLKL